MGSPVKMVVYAPDSQAAIQGSDAAYARLKQLDHLLSDYDPDSELMRLCAHQPAGEPVPVSQELFDVLAAALELSRRSEGAFDVTIGPVVKLWRVARRKKQLPDPDALKAALAKVGYQKVRLDPAQRTVSLAQTGMQLDLGAIAKGYAADEALRILAGHNLPQAMIAVAGDIRVGDPPPGQLGWKIAIEERMATAGAAPAVLELSRCAVSTAGDTYQYLEVGGVRYSHIVDAKTGLGLTTPSSITVVAPQGLLADGLDSTVNVLGPQQGLKLLQDYPQAQALIVQFDADGRRREWTTPGWSGLPRVEPTK